MFKDIKSKNNEAQTMIEYTIVIGIIIVVMFAMTPLIKRGTQGIIKVVADQIGNQQNADQLAFRGPNNTLDNSEGYLKSSYTWGRNIQDEETQETVGSTTFVHADQADIFSNVQLNLGFTPEIKR